MFRRLRHGVWWRGGRMRRCLSDRHVWYGGGLQRGGVRMPVRVLIVRRRLCKHLFRREQLRRLREFLSDPGWRCAHVQFWKLWFRLQSRLL